MSDMGKRSLRERRVPKNFDSDNQDNDPYGYGRPPYHRDLRTPSQLLNSDAKLLAKFINNLNKKIREHETDQRRKEIDCIKQPQPVRDRRLYQPQPSNDLPRRSVDSLPKPQPKKSKDIIYNVKGPANNSDAQMPQKNQAFLNKIKTITMESATHMRFLEMTLAKTKPGQPRALPDNPNPVPKANRRAEEQTGFRQGSQLQNGRNQQSQASRNGFFCKDKEKAKQINEYEEKLGLQKSDFNGSNKIFKRSAYHVAICYHIYLKKLREKGTMGNEIDPTYHARKLKEEMSRNS